MRLHKCYEQTRFQRSRRFNYARMCCRFNYKLSFKLQVQGRVTRQPSGTLIQFRITAALSPSPGKSGFLPLSRQFTVGQLFLFPVFLARLCPDFRKWSSENWAPHHAHLQREGSLLYTRELGPRAWPSLTNGQLLLLV